MLFRLDDEQQLILDGMKRGRLTGTSFEVPLGQIVPIFYPLGQSIKQNANTEGRNSRNDET